MKLAFLTANAAAQYRREVFEGRDYYVCPVVMMTPGVHSGNEGPLLYNSETNEKFAFAWSNKPITDGHPKDEIGNVVPANNTTVLNKYKLGMLLNAYGEKGNQKAEAWLDVELCQKKRPDILANLEAGKPMEVSIGLGRAIKPENGQLDGVNYIGVVDDYNPDHLAIMPPGVPAACGLGKGAGLLINGKSPILESIRRTTGLIVNGDTKLSDVHEKLWNAFLNKYGEPGKTYYGYLCEVYTEYFIVEEWDVDTYWKQEYTMTGDSVSLVGEKQKVSKEVTYKIVTNTLGSPSVDKSQLLATIAKLNLEATDKTHLGNMTEMGQRLIVNALTAPAPVPAPTPEPEKAKTLEELLKYATPETAMLVNGLVEQDKAIKQAQLQERNKTIDEILKIDPSLPRQELEATPPSILANQLKILKTPIQTPQQQFVPPAQGILANSTPVQDHILMPSNPWAKI